MRSIWDRCKPPWPHRPCYNPQRSSRHDGNIMSNERQPSPLLEALNKFEDSLEGRQAVLTAFMQSRVYVLLDRPWDGRSLPNSETRLLFVSDGENKDQAMLAVFTGREAAEGN